MRNYDLAQWSQTDITSISKENLVDIRKVKLDPFASVEELMSSFLNQIGNPYCFLYDSTPVRISFSEEEHTLQERMTRYFVSRKQA